jgi:hypothetical protein
MLDQQWLQSLHLVDGIPVDGIFLLLFNILESINMTDNYEYDRTIIHATMHPQSEGEYSPYT